MSAFEIMRRANLLDWHTLLLGLMRGWCEKTHLIEYAEERLRQTTGEVEGDLISIVAGESMSDEEIISVCFRLIETYGQPLSRERKDDALEKWRSAHLSSLMDGPDSDEEKIHALRILYGAP